MAIYLRGRFVRHRYQEVPHLHFKITEVRRFGKPSLNEHVYSFRKGQCFVIQPNRLKLREYDFLDVKGHLGRKDVIVGRIVKSRTHPGYWRLVLYEERMP